MTKTINKKIVLTLMAFVLSLCWLITPASAEETISLDVLSNETLCVEDTVEPLAVTNKLKGVSILVIPARYNSSKGAYERIMNEELWSSTGSGYTPYNCTVSSSISQWMSENDFNLFYVEIVYNISGSSSSYTVDFTVNNPEWTNYNTRVSGGNYVIQYMVPRKYHTYSISLTPKGSSNSLSLGGHISIG